jgi:hypothetical protein
MSEYEYIGLGTIYTQMVFIVHAVLEYFCYLYYFLRSKPVMKTIFEHFVFLRFAQRFCSENSIFIPVYFALRLIKTMLTCENAYSLRNFGLFVSHCSCLSEHIMPIIVYVIA